jgi:hypothetical protein
MASVYNVDIEAVLRFFDERPPESPGNATAVVAVSGEDLGIGLLCDYLQRGNVRAEGLDGPCTTGKKQGSRLDRWVRVISEKGKTLYQVEVKNWSAHAIGGVSLSISASPADVAEYKKRHWQDAWDVTAGTFSNTSLRKVLEQMRPPEPCGIHEPLASGRLCILSAKPNHFLRNLFKVAGAGKCGFSPCTPTCATCTLRVSANCVLRCHRPQDDCDGFEYCFRTRGTWGQT